MKRIRTILIFIVAAFGSFTLGAQHYVGVRGGYGVGFGRFFPAMDMKVVPGMWSGGIAWKYYNSGNFPEGVNKYAAGIGAEVEFLQRAFEYSVGRLNSDTTYRRTINTVNIPFIWQPHINFAGNRLRVFLNAGIAVSYNISSRQDTLIRGEGVVHTMPYKMTLVRDNPFGFGLQFGIGFNVIMGKWEIGAEGRYYFTYGDILRNRSVYPGPDAAHPNPMRSPVDNFNISVSLFYRLGDRPHIQQSSPAAVRRRAERMAKKEAKQLEKLSKNGNN